MTGRWNAPAARLFYRAALLGAAVGGRASLSVAGPVLTRMFAGRTDATVEPPGCAAAIVSASALSVELVVDKLPSTGSRLAGLGLAGRVGAAMLGALILARREHEGIGSFAVVGALAAAGLGAVLSSNTGVRWRAYTTERGMGLPGALAEDAVSVGLATAGSWPRKPVKRPAGASAEPLR